MSLESFSIALRNGATSSTRQVFTSALIALAAWGLSGIASGQVVSETAVAAPAQSVSKRLGGMPRDSKTKVTVMVELSDQPAALVYADALKKAVNGAGGNFAALPRTTQDQLKSAATSQSKLQVTKIEAAHQAVLPSLAAAAPGSRVVFRTKSAYNGISMLVTRGQLAALGKVAGVKAVHIMTPKSLMAANSLTYLNAQAAWTKVSGNTPFGVHGEGIRIADIDTGLDYIHTNFGGPGTPAAYASQTDTGPVPNAYFPSLKVPGGYDFAGDDYDANPNNPTYQPIPHPDPNPMDAGGHGTGTASLIGGLGVAAGGATYAGTYDNATDLAALTIAPGFAPRAFIYPLKVFGAVGSTDLVTQAIDWAVDPNGDGNVADHMDIINMSLGSDSAYADEPDAIAATNAAAAGVIVVSASGNAGDTYYITSAPAVASGTMSVAASFNSTGGFFYDASLTETSPTAGQFFPAIYGDTSPAFAPGGQTADIVYADPPTGAGVLTLNNAAAMPGKLCMIDRGTITFSAKIALCEAAGAIATIIVQSAAGAGSPNPVGMALTPAPAHPAVMIGLNDGAAIKAQLVGGPVTATGNSDNGFISQPTTAADTMASYSSRGPRLGDSMLKPDITAPAEVVGVAAALSGNQVSSFNGTSSATPHVSGIMALLKQIHPTWTVEELMALVMNTSTHDLFTGAGGTGAQNGAGRVGSGRVDVATAIGSNVVAFNQTDAGLVSVSFGIVEVPVASNVTLNKNITVKNNGATPVTYDVSYVDVTPVPGATFTVGTGSQITVPASGTVTLPVTFTATGNQLTHVREAAVPLQLPAGTSRQWLTEKTGYAVLTPNPNTGPTLRVALYASPKPVSAMAAGTRTPGGGPGQFTLGLTGDPVNTGVNFPTDIISLAKPFELQYVRSPAPPGPLSTDIIKSVGVTSDYLERGASPQNTVLTFMYETFANASAPSAISGEKDLYISVDGGQTFAYVIFLTSAANGTSQSNAYFPEVIDLNAGTALLRFRTNGINPNTRDTNAFNNSVVTIPVMATDVGLAGAGMPTKLMYEIFSFDRAGNQVDDTGLLTYDMAAPGVDAQGGNTDPFFYDDVPATTIPVVFNAANLTANASLGMILAHMHNATGARTEVITAAVAPVLQGAVARKVHGAGTFDLPLTFVP